MRQQLIGTSTVPVDVPSPDVSWGRTCRRFLDAVSKHTSKASKSYYYKNHAQYFDGISNSVSELGRTLKRGGVCILVVQDSFYKDVHNNLPQVFIEMGKASGLRLERRADFHLRRSMAGINTRTRKYRKPTGATESVLCFVRE